MNLVLKDISLGFRGVEKPLLSAVNIDINQGVFVSLVGRNGAGKSTLLKSLVGILKPLRGDILISGESIVSASTHHRAKLVSFVSTEVISVAHLRVWDVVAMGRMVYSNWYGGISVEDRRIIEESLERVGMSNFKEKGIDSLSDGERGRVMIARALAQQTPIILLDEPTAFLDLPNRYMVMGLLRDLAHKYDKIVILSTHELNLACEFADRLWIVSQGSVFDGEVEQMKESRALRSIFESIEQYKIKK